MKTARNQTEACCAINTLCVRAHVCTCVCVCYCEHLFLFVSQDRVWFITNTDIKFWSRAVNYCPVFQRVDQQNNRRLLIIKVIRQSEDTVLQNFREALSCYRVESRRSDMRALIKDDLLQHRVQRCCCGLSGKWGCHPSTGLVNQDFVQSVYSPSPLLGRQASFSGH